VVGVAYAIDPTSKKLAEYYNILDDPALKAVNPGPPDESLGRNVFHPNSRSFIPGTITGESTISTGAPAYLFLGSHFSGMSGGPVFTLEQGIVQVGAQIVSASKKENSNRLSILAGPFAAFLQRYSQSE